MTDVHSLSGAYALDAVDDLERAAFERHLRALCSGNYAARVAVRSGDFVYAELADQLNQLAAQLQEYDRSRAR